MSKKRCWEQPAVDTQLIEIYEDLANVDEKIRLKAAYALLTNFVSGEKATGVQLNEILRRLIRGLCSGRKAARLGFSIALTELLTELLGPNGKGVEGFHNISGLLETWKAQTHVSGNVSGQEERDHQFGRLFGAESIIKSEILFQRKVDIEAWNQVLDCIYELAIRKSWLREECGFILFTSVHILRDKDLTYSQLIIDKLYSNGLSKTTEGVAIWIAAQTESPSLKFPSGIWHRENPLDRKEQSRLAGIMNESPAAEPAWDGSGPKVPRKGAWSPNMHFAWDVILAKLLPVEPAAPKSTKSKRISFVAFWERCVDDNLFAASSSEERKFSGFVLFQRMITKAPVHIVPDLFTKNFMRCLKNQLASSERYLHRTAARAAKAIVARACTHPSLRSLILKALLSNPNGDVSFDKVTKTKTVEKILSQCHDSPFEQLGNLYDGLILRPGGREEKEAALRRLVLAEQLASVVRGLHLKPTLQDLGPSFPHRTIRDILSLFAKYAYFDAEIASNDQDSEPKIPISQASRQMFRSRISYCLSHLIAQPIEDPAFFPYSLICAIQDRETNPSLGPLLLEADKGVVEIVQRARETLGKVHSRAQDLGPGAQLDYFRSIILLYCLTILQVYNEDPEAVTMLAEINDLFQGKLHSKGSREQGAAALVEILLSFISKPSQLFRRLAQQVFTACAANLDVDSIQSMIKVLETKENLFGQAEMFDQDDEVDGMSDISDVEEVDVVDAESTSSSAGDGSEDSDANDTSESSNEDSSSPDDEVVAFDAKLAQALGTRPGNKDLSAEDSSSSDEDMDDEQMAALDEHLEKVFRERKKVTSRKKEREDAKEIIVNFKCRVLELLDIYVKQQHSNSLALSLLVPILAAIRTSTSPLVSSKACSLMREYAKLCKGDCTPKVGDADTVFELLKAVHTEAMKEGSNAYASACSQASLLLVRVLVAHDRECLRRVVRIYGETQEKALFDSSCRIKTSFFTDWQNWCTSARK